MRPIFPISAVLVLACFVSAAAAQERRFEVAYPSLKFDRPLLLVPLPGDADAVAVVEQNGRIVWFENRSDMAEGDVKVALDIRGGKVLRSHNEEGLLGFAFHPRFAENGQVFLHYSAGGPRRNVLSRWKWEDGAIVADSEEVILEVEQPWGNHNGGHIEFGPDGYLYVTLGDGGSGGDPLNSGQRLDTLLGKILRIDVDREQEGLAYAIPADNPFVGREDARGEIWAYGLRNVWRFSFDRETGELWAGDVGQNAFEEIDVIVKGGNYGWKVREGFAAYKGGPLAVKPADMIDPVVHYPRSEGISVTGGYVYRGEAVPELRGAYIYGDFGSGNIWAVRRTGDSEAENVKIGNVKSIASFGLDRAGELYVCSFDGRIYKMSP